MDEAKKGRQLSLHEPAIEVKRNECRETRRRFQQPAWFLRKRNFGFRQSTVGHCLRWGKDRRPLCGGGPAVMSCRGQRGPRETASGGPQRLIWRNEGEQFRSAFNLTAQ